MDAMSSPRPWGCFRQGSETSKNGRVFPTPVGVFPKQASMKAVFTSLPHARGGVSFYLPRFHQGIRSSPRPWGCFPDRVGQLGDALVFPTPVGVFLEAGSGGLWRQRLPHARGGVSNLSLFRITIILSSPRPWGCFFQKGGTGKVIDVFPTPVGVFPSLD